MAAPAEPDAGIAARGPATRRRLRAAFVGAVLLVLCVVGIGASLLLGSERLPAGEVIRALGPDDGTASPAVRQIVRQLRLPRALLAGLIGVNLAVAGVLLQGVMRNPLAAPNVVGVTAGAGLGAAAALTLLAIPGGWLPLCAFAGAFASALVVYFISWQPGTGTSPVRMVLAGVAITAILGALTTYLMVASDQAQVIVGWMAGSLEGRSWPELRTVLPYSIACLALSATLARGMDLLQLGDDAARGLGVSIERSRFAAIALAALLAGAAVSVAGLIGFIGLVVPHIVRLVIGSAHGLVIPVAALGGAALMIWADVAAQSMLDRQTLPVGVLTALIGGPYFIFLLYRTKLLR